MVAQQRECDGSETAYGYGEKISTAGGCANKCQDSSSMFAFGTNAFGNTRCEDGACKCLCETSATSEGTCNQVSHSGYNLYRYTKGTIFSFTFITI